MADGFNMVIRIVYSGRFIAMGTLPIEAAALLRASLPTMSSALALLLASVVTGMFLHPAATCRLTDLMPSLSGSHFCADFSETLTLGRGHLLPSDWHCMRGMGLPWQLTAHVGTGAACLAGVLLIMYKAERQSFTDAFTILRTRNGEQKAD